MRTSYFTFGQAHTHRYNGTTLDCDIVVKITSEDPRDTMVELFGNVWSMQYDNQPDMRLFPRGFYEIDRSEGVSA